MSDLRESCAGVPPLPGRLEPWQIDVAGNPDTLSALVEAYGSPVNLINPEAMERNAAELSQAADERHVPLRIFFARKANKALSLVDRAAGLGLGVDVASERELSQVLGRGVDPGAVIVTAAVKPRALLELCVREGVLVAIDNLDELALHAEAAGGLDEPAPIAVRLAPEGVGKPTRFGMPSAEILDALTTHTGAARLEGVHFHLDGYDPAERSVAIGEAVRLVDALRERGHDPRWIDIGGGIPMSYLESEADWLRFWTRPNTYDGHEIRHTYPYWQQPVRGEWLAQVLDAPTGGTTVAGELRERGLELRCEPGRSLLDGCGMTVARVEFRKRRADGTFLAGLAMNRTQMRSTSDDFLVDPLLVRPSDAGEPSDPVDGFLVGAYCIERELISWRRFDFPRGVAVGDLIAFPNTAGYLMHILESASHQIPLAKNLVVCESGLDLDPIDA